MHMVYLKLFKRVFLLGGGGMKNNKDLFTCLYAVCDEPLYIWYYLDNEDEDDGHGQGYLHPSLMVTRKAAPAPEVPAYKPIEMPKISVHDTPYGQLIKSLVKKQQPDPAEE